MFRILEIDNAHRDSEDDRLIEGVFDSRKEAVDYLRNRTGCYGLYQIVKPVGRPVRVWDASEQVVLAKAGDSKG